MRLRRDAILGAHAHDRPVKTIERLLFPKTGSCLLACKWGSRVIITALFTAFIAVNLHQFLGLAWRPLVITGVLIVALSLPVFGLAAKRQVCAQQPEGDAS